MIITTQEYAQLILEVKKETPTSQMTDESTAYDAAQLISGSFTFPLYQALWVNSFDMDTIAEHLEALFDSGNHFGLVFIVGFGVWRLLPYGYCPLYKQHSQSLF